MLEYLLILSFLATPGVKMEAASFASREKCIAMGEAVRKNHLDDYGKPIYTFECKRTVRAASGATH